MVYLNQGIGDLHFDPTRAKALECTGEKCEGTVVNELVILIDMDSM